MKQIKEIIGFSKNWCDFPKFMVSEKATCVKTEGGAVIQTAFSDRTNVFFSNENYIV